MADRKSAGDALMDKAAKKLTEWGMPWSKDSRMEAAAALYQDAAAQYKLSKLYDLAGQAHTTEAKVHEDMKNHIDATEAYLQAAKAYKNGDDVKQASKFYGIVANRFMEKNRFSPAAKIYKQIAELNVEEMEYKAAYAAYEQASDCYEVEDNPAHQNSMLLAMADLAGEKLEDYKGALTLYEKISGQVTSGSSWAVSSYLYKAILCRWVIGLDDVDEIDEVFDKFEQYREQYPKFDDSKEATLIEALIKCWQESNEQNFRGEIFKYDQRYNRLDIFQQTMFTKIVDVLADGGFR